MTGNVVLAADFEAKCPKDTVPVVTNTEFWCRMVEAKGVSVAHGPYFRWYADENLTPSGKKPWSPATGYGEGKGLNSGWQAVKIRGQFEKGKRVGTWVYFDEQGKKWREEKYKDDRLVEPTSKKFSGGKKTES